MDCPHCQKQVIGEADFCPSCAGILPLPEEFDHYRALGYVRLFLNLDPADLEKRYFQLSKKFHPDRYASKSALAIQLAHDRSSAVNNAYRTLKNRVERAKYAVERELGSIEEKSAAVPPDMADLFFEVHESLDLISESNGQPPADAVAVVERTKKELGEKVGDLEMELERKFIQYDESGSREVIDQMKELLSHRSYIKSFLRRIDSIMTGGSEEH